MLGKKGWLVIGHPQTRLRGMLLVVTRNSALAHAQTHLTMETDLHTEGNLGNKGTQEVGRKWHANLRFFFPLFSGAKGSENLCIIFPQDTFSMNSLKYPWHERDGIITCGEKTGLSLA